VYVVFVTDHLGRSFSIQTIFGSTLKVLIHNFTQLSYGGLLTYLCYYRVSIMTTAIVKITLDLISSSGVNTR
jgi:hypothetical protein